MPEMTDSEQIAGLTSTVLALKEEVHGLRQDLKDQRDNFVPSREFIAWKTGIDREIADMKMTHAADMTEVRAAHQREVDARRAARAPWWSVVAALAGVAAVALTIVLNLNSTS